MTICDFSCSGPSLLKAAKRKFPNAKLYAYNDKGIGLKLRRILEKELGNNVNIIEEMKDDIKFDHIIMNPPYDKNLHLKILREAMRYSDDIVNLSPIRWLQDPLAEYKKNSDFKNFEDIRTHIESLDIVPMKEAIKQFNTDIPTDLGIYRLTPQGGWDSTSLWNKTVIKVLNKSRENIKDFDINQKDGWRVRVSVICGGRNGGGGAGRKVGLITQRLIGYKDGMKDGKPWHEHYMKNQYSKTTPEIPYSIKFDTEEEMNNFLKVQTSILGRWFYDKMVVDVNINNTNFLWLPDYTNTWTDEDLYKYFDLTQEEIQAIEMLI